MPKQTLVRDNDGLPVVVSPFGHARGVLGDIQVAVTAAEGAGYTNLQFELTEENDLELWGVAPETEAEKEAKKARRRQAYERLKREFGDG